MSQNRLDEILTPYLIAAVLQTDGLLSQVQRELYRLLPGITVERLRQVIREEILRPDMIQGKQADDAQLTLKRIAHLRAEGLSTTETLKVITKQASQDAEEGEDVNQTLLDDKRSSGTGG